MIVSVNELVKIDFWHTYIKAQHGAVTANQLSIVFIMV